MSPVISLNESPAPEPTTAIFDRGPNLALELALRLPPGQFEHCVECGEPPRDVGCERCGAGLHDTCYFWFVTPRAEREFYKAHDPDASLRVRPDAESYFYMRDDAKYLIEEHGGYAFICKWCRG